MAMATPEEIDQESDPQPDGVRELDGAAHCFRAIQPAKFIHRQKQST